MDLTAEMRDQIARYSELGQWNRAELGRALRRLGLSYGEIMELIPVPKGTLSGWCREIRLTEVQADAIRLRTGSQLGVPRDTQRKRREEIRQIRASARQFARGHLQDPLWVAGTVLYWGEGAKIKRSLALANADESALRLFIRWTERYHSPVAGFVLALHLHAGNHEQRAREYWRSALGIDDFFKTFIKPRGSGQRKNHLPHGVCRVYVRRSTDAWLRTMTWIEVLSSEQDALANLFDGSLAQSGRATDS